MFRPADIITLTTDFGLNDAYVGQLKGAALCRNSAVQLIDLCHAIPRQDILSAALSLRTSYSFFPRGTVHLAVVDPGVGSERGIFVAASADEEYLFIAPDNGTLSLLFADQIIHRIRCLENSTLSTAHVSSTFHGRDIMAPAAAALAGGFPFAQVGPTVPITSCVQLDLSKPVITAERIEGKVLQVDHFGNIRTNIIKDDLDTFEPSAVGSIMVGKHRISGLCGTYADVSSGELVALIDSAGYLEIALNMGNAAGFVGCAPDDPVIVFLKKKK